MAMDPWSKTRRTPARLRRAAAEAAARGSRLRLDQRTAMLILRATGAAELDPEVLVGLLVTSLEQANLAPVLEAKWRQRGEAALGPRRRDRARAARRCRCWRADRSAPVLLRDGVGFRARRRGSSRARMGRVLW